MFSTQPSEAHFLVRVVTMDFLKPVGAIKNRLRRFHRRSPKSFDNNETKETY